MGTSVLVVFVAAVFTENILLSRFLGMCSFLSVSRQVKTAVGLGGAVTFVLTCTSALNWLVYRLLVAWDLEYLRYIAFIIVIAAFVQFVEIVIERASPVLYYALGIFLPLITVNCAILGASLFMIIRKYSFMQSLGFGVGAGVGWALAILLMAGLRSKMGYSNVPKPFQGVAIAMVITGVMAMAFMGFAGMVTIQ